MGIPSKRTIAKERKRVAIALVNHTISGPVCSVGSDFTRADAKFIAHQTGVVFDGGKDQFNRETWEYTKRTQVI